MLKNIVVDIKTRFIDENRRVFILFPGNGYRYYEYMKNNSSIFLDIPGFPIADGESLSDAKDLIQRVIVSDRIRHWHYNGRPNDDLPVRETKNLKDYRISEAKKIFAGLVRGFFTNVKPGDVVIVPPPTYDGDILYGEVQPIKEQHFAELPEFPEEKVPALKVEWVKTVPRHKAPGWLERKIPSPNPLRQIEKEHYPAIFDIMFERYYYRGKFSCKFNVTSSDFSALDDFLFQQIVLYVSALHEDIHENNIDVKNNSIAVVASRIEYSEDIPELKMNINSPGDIVVYSKNIIPLVAGVLIALAATVPALAPFATVAGEIPSVTIVNSVDSSQIARECIADVQREASQDLRAMGYPRWQELCAIEMQARRRTGLSSGMEADALGVVAPSALAQPKQN